MRQPVPFGKYLLLDRISVGGMAEVFKAKSYGVEGFEKIIAIKRILPTMGEDRDFIKMFIDEAKIAGQLAHANICQIFELGRIDGSHFIAMEYIWGKDLLQIQNRLRKTKQPMPVPMACFVIAKVLEGLDYAHRKRDPLGRPLEIVHRDCSPQNVLVSYEGEVKLIDFGIAKATSRNSRTMAGVLKGKFGYMSPEQVRGLPLDRRSDIFAIGTMLYECLTGERLFQGETDFSTLEKVRNVDIVPPRQLNPEIPESVEKVILKALAKDVEDRYQWCNEMLADLQAYLMGQDVVFTAKSLSSWLKEVFSQEIERERNLLEQYKRVGRDGLIGGVPSAEAKLDVVEHLGVAGAPEGDATTLGGPSFDDVEKDTGAAPELGHPHPDDDVAEDAFHDEAPTEIFGEMEGAPPPAAGAPPSGSRQHPATKPPRPPPGRASTQRPAEVPMGIPMVSDPRSPTQHMQSSGPMQMAPMQQAYPQYPAMTGPVSPVVPQVGPDGEVQRTVLGVQAPQPNMYPMRPSMPQQMSPAMQAYYAAQPQYPPGYAPPGYAPPQYNTGYAAPVGTMPIDPALEGKRSTLVRDIAIGVGIAALVLIGFLVVKMLVLDADKSAGGGSAAATSQLATVKFAMPKGMTAEMFIDGKRIATVTTESPGVPVSAGTKHIKLVSGGLSCDDPKVVLEAGKTTTLECTFGLQIGPDGTPVLPPPPPPPPAGSAAPQGSAAGSAAGSGAGSGSAADDKLKKKDSKKPPTATPGKGSADTTSKPAEPGSDPTKGYVDLVSKPSAKILIDNVDTGKTTPTMAMPLAPGKHKITFAVGDDKFTYPVTVTAGKTETLNKELQ